MAATCSSATCRRQQHGFFNQVNLGAQIIASGYGGSSNFDSLHGYLDTITGSSGDDTIVGDVNCQHGQLLCACGFE